MNLRTLKQRHDARTARTLAYSRAWEVWPDDAIDERDDDCDDYACTHCGGEGFAEVDDPLWDDCDEFGYGPCKSCRGTGLRREQWVF